VETEGLEVRENRTWYTGGIVKFPLVYLFGPIDSCLDAHVGWRGTAKKELYGCVTIFDPLAAFSCSMAGQEVIPINEMVVDNAEVLLGSWDPCSVGASREVERAIIKGKPVVVIHPPISGNSSPYYLDRRVVFTKDVFTACSYVRGVINGSRSDI
jgi:hypothetical protein